MIGVTKVDIIQDMTLFAIIYFHTEQLKRLNECGIKIDDWRYTNLYKEYLDMRKQYEKISYIVAVLAAKYNVCERTVYNIINRFGSHCKTDAVRNAE